MTAGQKRKGKVKARETMMAAEKGRKSVKEGKVGREVQVEVAKNTRKVVTMIQVERERKIEMMTGRGRKEVYTRKNIANKEIKRTGEIIANTTKTEETM